MSIPYPPGEFLTCQQIRELDDLAIEQIGIPGVVLMENAGRSAAGFVYGTLPNPAHERVVVLCGSGNNGGDGFVVARHLRNASVAVDVVLAVPAEKIKGDAAINLHILERMGQPLLRANEEAGLEATRAALRHADVVVDALLGTGSRGAPRGVMGELVQLANASERARRMAIDIPSGLDADAGTVHEPCFRAHATVTMLAGKVGFETEAGRSVVGRVIPVEIGTPRDVIPGRPEFRHRG